MRHIILETRDGWRKKMTIPAREHQVRIPVMSARDFAIERDGDFDPARTAHFQLMTFEWDGDEVELDTTGLDVLEVWREV